MESLEESYITGVRRLGNIELDSIRKSGKFIPLDLPVRHTGELRYIIISKLCVTDQNSTLDAFSWDFTEILPVQLLLECAEVF